MVTVAAICEAFSECSCQASCCNYSWRCETTKWRGFQDIPVKGDRCSWIFSSRCFPVLLPKVPMCRSWQKCRWFREFWMPLSHFQSLSRSCFVLPASKPKPNPRVDIASWWLQQMVLGCFRAILCCFRGMETRTLARLECETVKQLHPDKCFCFRFRRHLLGGHFFRMCYSLWRCLTWHLGAATCCPDPRKCAHISVWQEGFAGFAIQDGVARFRLLSWSGLMGWINFTMLHSLLQVPPENTKGWL